MFSIVLAAAVAQTPLPRQWAQFSRSGALSRVSETVDIATGEGKGTAQFPYKLRLTRSSPEGKIEIKWAESTTCPTVRSVIASMHDIAMPLPAPYGVPGESTEIIVDGAGYFLTAPSSYIMGKMTLTSNVGSPLAKWIDTALEQLAPCWTETRVTDALH